MLIGPARRPAACDSPCAGDVCGGNACRLGTGRRPCSFARGRSLFETKIRPVLATTCFKCHGGQKTSNNLRVDRRQSLFKGGDSGPALVPGHPDKSLLICAPCVISDDDLKMPPDKKLPDAVIADFEWWIRRRCGLARSAGAESFRQEEHWAFRPVRKIEPPLDASGWSANAVDCFIHAGSGNTRTASRAAAAGKRTLLRRAYFDLIGLAADSAAEVAAFLADKSPEAFANVIETPAWLAAVRRAVGPLLDGRRPLCRHGRRQCGLSRCPKRGCIAITSSTRSTRTSRTISSSASRWRATCWPSAGRRTILRAGGGHGLSGPVAAVRDGPLRAVAFDARRHDRHGGPGLLGNDAALRGATITSSIPISDARLLRALRQSSPARQFPYAGSEEFQSMKFGRRDFAALVPATARRP